jgi:hypothetical protein
VRHVARVREERKLCRVLVGKPEGNGQLGRPRRRWGDGLIFGSLGDWPWGCEVDSNDSE